MAWETTESGLEYVEVAQHPDQTLPASGWTLAWWLMYLGRASGFRYVMSWAPWAANPSISIYSDGNQFLRFYVVATATVNMREDYGVGLVGYYGTWQHLALVHDGSDLSIYINGAYHKSAASSGFSDLYPSAHPWVWGTNAAYNINNTTWGRYAELAAWGRALPAREIRGLGAGRSPDHYPRDLSWYMDARRPYVERRHGYTVTNTATFAGRHPPIRYPTAAMPRYVGAAPQPPAANPYQMVIGG